MLQGSKSKSSGKGSKPVASKSVKSKSVASVVSKVAAKTATKVTSAKSSSTKVSPKASPQVEKVVRRSKEFSDFTVSLMTGSKRKRRLSNYLRLDVDAEKTNVSCKLTIREAQALRHWLNEHLESDSV